MADRSLYLETRHINEYLFWDLKSEHRADKPDTLLLIAISVVKSYWKMLCAFLGNYCNWRYAFCCSLLGKRSNWAHVSTVCTVHWAGLFGVGIFVSLYDNSIGIYLWSYVDIVCRMLPYFRRWL